MRRSPVVGAAFGLLSFYWISFFALDFLRGEIGFSGAWVDRLSLRGIAMGGGGLLGILVVTYGIWLKRKLARMRLIGDNVRGVTCSIGALPVMLQPPSQSKVVLQTQQMRLPRHKCIDPEWKTKWIEEYRDRFPEHVAMLQACERVMNSKPNLPAACKNGERKGYEYGYDGHNHGNHTLLEHAYTTGAVGVHLSGTFEFEGVFKTNAQGGKEGISKKNPNYHFEPDDPMIGLLCYTHDIGKVETFGFNDRGEVIATNVQHDLAGARLMARMDEFWRLPAEDRMILLLAVSHYHRPSEMPLDRNGQLISDRCQALLELVIAADIRAGLIENGQEDELGKVRDVPIIEETYQANLWRAFIELVIESGRINGARDKYGIGQKNVVDKRALVIVYEKDVRDELLTRMELRNSHKGRTDERGIYTITRDLLRLLHEKNMLVTSAGDVTAAAPEDALWQVDWYGRDPKRAGAPISKSMCTIAFEPKGEISLLAEMMDHDSVPKLVGLFGDGIAEDTRKERLRVVLNLEQPGGDNQEEDLQVPQILEDPRKKKKKKRDPKPVLTDGTVPASATASSTLDAEGGHAVDSARPEINATPTRPNEQLELLSSVEDLTITAPAVCGPVEEQHGNQGSKSAPLNAENPRLAAALEGVKKQIRDKVLVDVQELERRARNGVGKDGQHPVKAGLLHTLRLAEENQLPSEDIGEGVLAVSINALKALDNDTPWLTEPVVSEIVARRWPGVKVSRRDNGVFMLELKRDLIEAHHPQ